MSAFLFPVAQMAEITEAPSSAGRAFEWMMLFNPAVVWVLIPIVAILAGTIAKIIQRSQEHRERMAMIGAGLHPDFPPDEDPQEGEQDGWRGVTADFSPRS